MAKKASPKRVKFEFKAQPGSSVFLAGSFNDWDPCQIQLADKKGAGTYSTSVPLSSGKHEYKFVVNGHWTIDPKCPDCVGNDKGSMNSVVTV